LQYLVQSAAQRGGSGAAQARSEAEREALSPATAR